MLIVEDDRELALGLETYFTHVGYQVETVDQGSEALDALRTIGPDVVLLDWRLPGKTGSEVLREARAEGVEAPTIMLSVHTRGELRKKIRAPDPDFHLTKPFDLEDLEERVEVLLNTSEKSG